MFVIIIYRVHKNQCYIPIKTYTPVNGLCLTDLSYLMSMTDNSRNVTYTYRYDHLGHQAFSLDSLRLNEKSILSKSLKVIQPYYLIRWLPLMWSRFRTPVAY